MSWVWPAFLDVRQQPTSMIPACLYVASLPLCRWPTPSVIVIIFATVFIIILVFVIVVIHPLFLCCPYISLFMWMGFSSFWNYFPVFSKCAFEVCDNFVLLTQFMCRLCLCYFYLCVHFFAFSAHVIVLAFPSLACLSYTLNSRVKCFHAKINTQWGEGAYCSLL